MPNKRLKLSRKKGDESASGQPNKRQAKEEPSKKSKKRGISAPCDVTGLTNLGNTCYANAVLQSLYHCHEFRDTLRAITKQAQPNADSGPCRVGSSLQALFAEMDAEKKKAVAPKAFIDAVRAASPTFSTQGQQDSQEFLSFILNCVQALEGTPNQETKKQAKGMPRSECMDEDKEVGAVTIQRLFEATTRNSLRCLQCERSSSQSEPVWDLSLSVAGCESVPGALGSHFSSEWMRGLDKYQCESCHALTEAERKLRLSSLAPVMPVVLKCFAQDGSPQAHKLGSREAIPPLMRLDQWCEVGCAGREAVYELVSIVAHSGQSTKFGHYIAFVKATQGGLGASGADAGTSGSPGKLRDITNNGSNGSGMDGGVAGGEDAAAEGVEERNWLCFDDCKVTSLTEAEAFAHFQPSDQGQAEAVAYVLFYKRSNCLADALAEVALTGSNTLEDSDSE